MVANELIYAVKGFGENDVKSKRDLAAFSSFDNLSTGSQAAQGQQAVASEGYQLSI